MIDHPVERQGIVDLARLPLFAQRVPRILVILRERVPAGPHVARDHQIAVAAELGLVEREPHLVETLRSGRIGLERIGGVQSRRGSHGPNEVGRVDHHRVGRPEVQHVAESHVVGFEVAIFEVVE